MKTIHLFAASAITIMALNFNFFNKYEGRIKNNYTLIAPQMKYLPGHTLSFYSVIPLEDSPLIEKYWKLVTLNNLPVISRDPRQSEPHMILKAFKNEVRGNGGCNSFSANYELKEQNEITITPVIAGENSCKNLRTENQFFKFLAKAKSYEVAGDSLFMQDASGRLTAKFVAVYF